VKVENHILGLASLDSYLDASDAPDINRILLDIGRHRHLRYEFAERRPKCRDIRVGVEPALAQDRIQLELLLFAHQYFSRLGVDQRETLHVDVARLQGARSIQIVTARRHTGVDAFRSAHDRLEPGDLSSPDDGDSPISLVCCW
jgi:hypothetical protein